eukprot:3301-Heterococcus_DN1.PRE.1
MTRTACVLLAVMSASAFLFAPMHQTAVHMRSVTCVASKGDAFDNQHTVEEPAEPEEKTVRLILSDGTRVRHTVCDDRDLRRVLRAHDAVGLLVANPDGTVKGDAEGEFVRVISQ